MTNKNNEVSDILKYDRPAITADCILFTAIEKIDEPRGGDLGLQVRLVKRQNSPEQGKWALLGAFVPVDERIENVMRKAVRCKGGYTDDFYHEQLFTFDTPGRDERWRVISVAYIGIANMYQGSAQYAPDAHWFYVNYADRTLYQPVLDLTISFDDLAFDHGEILSVAIDRLQAKITYSDIALNFLTEPFSIKDIKRVMEAVTGKPCNNPQRTFEKYIERISEDGMPHSANSSRDGEEESSKRPAHRPSLLYKRKNK